MDYDKKLRELKTAFLEGVTLQSGITVFRTMNVVQNIAKLSRRSLVVRCLRENKRSGPS